MYNETACAALADAFIEAGAQTLYALFSSPLFLENNET
jgi:hypothetical protein